MDIAAALIQIEDHLDEALVGMILPRNSTGNRPAGDADFQQVQAAVLRECVVNLARVKEYVSQNVGGTLDAAGFDNWQDLMRGIQAGLLMLGKSRAVQCIERVSAYLKHVMQPGGSRLAPQALDRLADAIVSIEYYMETLQAGRADRLVHARQRRERAGGHRGRACTCSADGESRSAMRPTCAPCSSIRRPTPPCRTRSPLASLHGTPPVLAPTLQARPALAAAADPELIALFMEEAREEQAKIARFLPEWDQDPANEDALVNARRALPHAQGQWPRGRRHRAGGVLLVHREPAQPPARQDADPIARHPR